MTDGYTGDGHLLTRRPGSSSAASTSSGDAGQPSAAPAACSPGPATSSPSARRTRPSRTLAPWQRRPWRGPAGRAPPALRRGRRARDHREPAAGLAGRERPGLRARLLLRDDKEQVFLSTRDFTVDWTNNVRERGAKAAKRHEAVSGDWQILATFAAGAASGAILIRRGPRRHALNAIRAHSPENPGDDDCRRPRHPFMAPSVNGHAGRGGHHPVHGSQDHGRARRIERLTRCSDP